MERTKTTKMVFMLAVVLAAAGFCTAENLVINSGFETSEATGGGWPSSYGHWNGDYSSIVSASSGIVPLEVSKMLKFIGTAHTTFPSSAVACEVPQLVDVSEFAGLFESGRALVSASAYFNRVAGDAQTDTSFSLVLYALEGEPSSYPVLRESDTYLQKTWGQIYSDDDPATWEQCHAELLLPGNTDFVVIQVTAGENVYNDTSGTEFDGHFADAVFLEVAESNGPAGPIAHWKFDEGEGSIAYDSAGDNDGTIYGAQWTASIIGDYALAFDGSGDYVLVGDKDVLEPQRLTLSFWAQLDNPSGYAQGGIAKGYVFGSPPEYSYKFDFHQGWARACISHDDSSSTSYTTTTVADSNWHFWTMTVDGNAISIYRDGIGQNSSPISGPIDYTKTHNNFLIGARENGTDCLDGKLDEVTFYDRALSAEEIQQLYQEGAGGPIAHWKFDEGEGLTAYDSAGDNDGTLVNGPIWTTSGIDGALDFDGSNDWVSVDDSNQLDLPTSLTVSVLISLADLGDGGILGKYDNWGEYNYAIWYEGGTLFFQVGNSGPSKYDPSQFETRLSCAAIDNPNQWYHIAGTYNSNKLRLFVDGTEVAQVDESRQLGNGCDPLCIGTVKFDGVSSDMFNETEAYFNGMIDDVRIYDRALSAEEIQQLYEQAAPEPTGVFYVDGVNGSDLNDGLSLATAFATIQKGIDDANHGDTVVVYPAVYTEPVNFDGKAITVQGVATEAGVPIQETPMHYAFSFYTDEERNSVLKNFVVRNSYLALFLIDASPTIRNLTIVDNWMGMEAYTGSEPDISNCIFYGNTDGDLFGCDAQYSFVQGEEITDGLVSHLKFDEGEGTTAYDSAGTNDGILINEPVWTNGVLDGALDFDGSNDYVDVGTENSLKPNHDDVTYAAWFKTGYCGTQQKIMMFSAGTGWSQDGNYQLFVDPDGNITARVRRRGGSGDTAASVTGQNVSDNSWHFAAFTWDFSTLTIEGFLDGSSFGTDGLGAGWQDHLDQSGRRFSIGVCHYATGDVDYFNGTIDDVRIYNRALSAEEVQQVYEYGLGPMFADANGGDYHLLSERGRHWPEHDVWVLDEATSPCVDGGDPNDNPADERMPNGGRVNMGVYGGTAYASMSEWPLRSDMDRDGQVNMKDFAILAGEWLEELGWLE